MFAEDRTIRAEIVLFSHDPLFSAHRGPA